MPTDEETRTANRSVVVRFNEEVIERGDEAASRALMAPDVVNRSAPPGMPSGPDGMFRTFSKALRPAFPDLTVEIHDQIAEGARVTTRRTIRGTDCDELLGIPATNRPVAPSGSMGSTSSARRTDATSSTGASTRSRPCSRS